MKLSRFCKPRISAQKNKSTQTNLNPFETFEVLQTSNQHTKLQLRAIQLNPLPLRGFFRRPRRLFFPPCGGPLLLPQHFCRFAAFRAARQPYVAAFGGKKARRSIAPPGELPHTALKCAKTCGMRQCSFPLFPCRGSRQKCVITALCRKSGR